MHPCGLSNDALREQYRLENITRSLQDQCRLSTALHKIGESARQRQLEMQQVPERVLGRSTSVLDTAREAFGVMEKQRLEIHALEQRCASVWDLAEQSTRNLHDLFRLPTSLQEMAENSTLQQALQQATAWERGSRSSLEKAALAWEETSRQVGERLLGLTQTLGAPSALTALQEMEEVHRRAQEMKQAYERIVGDQSVWGQARHALEECGSQARALQDRVAQCGRGLQSQMEQATALARSVGWDQAPTPFAPGGPPNRSRTSFTVPTGSVSFRFLGPKDLARLGPSKAQRQDEHHREILAALRDLKPPFMSKDPGMELASGIGTPSVSVSPNLGGRPPIKETFLRDFLSEVETYIKTYRILNKRENPSTAEIWGALTTPFTGRSPKTYLRWVKRALALQESSAPNTQAWIKTLSR